MAGKCGNIKIAGKISLILIFSVLISSSCLKEFPESFPDNYVWNAELAVPLGYTTLGLKTENGYDSMLLEIDTLSGHSHWADLPEIGVKGSFSFNFSEILNQLNGVEKVVLRVNIQNGFPVDFRLQSYLLDEYDLIIDSLFTPMLFVHRGVRAGGGWTREASNTTVDVIFTGEEVYNLAAVRKIFISAVIPSTPYFPEYSFKVQLGALIRYKTEFPAG